MPKKPIKIMGPQGLGVQTKGELVNTAATDPRPAATKIAQSGDNRGR